MEEIILNGEISKSDVNKDTYLNISLESSHKNTPISNLTAIVNANEQFLIERDNSTCYRFKGIVNIIASNVLVNWSGLYSYQDILLLRDFDNDTQEYVYTTEEILKEKDGWFFYYVEALNGYKCQKQYLEPLPERFSLLNLQGLPNWNVCLTYPASTDKVPLIFNGVPLNRGIGVWDVAYVLIDNRIMVKFTTSIKHGLSAGSVVSLTSFTVTVIDGTYNVYKIGDVDNLFKDNIFVIDINPVSLPNLATTKTAMRRIVDNVPSEYYGRWFKRITEVVDYDSYLTAFAKNYNNDKIFSFTFNKDIDISQYVDYLSRPLTEVYVTLIKNRDNSFWTAMQSGVNPAITNSNYDINSIMNLNINDCIENGISILNEDFFGDIIEYNPIELSENILEIAYHRFNSTSRSDDAFHEGYYYKPHYKVNIRELSEYIEQKFSGDEDVPDYAEILPDNRALYRELLPNSFVDNPNIPFLNGCHYIFENINLNVKRQDPCGIYGLGIGAIIGGSCVELEKVEQEIVEDNC